MSSVLKDPGLNVVVSDYRGKISNSHMNKPRAEVEVKKTEVGQPADQKSTSAELNSSVNKICPIHNAPQSLNECKVFKQKDFKEHKEKGICYKCCESDSGSGLIC